MLSPRARDRRCLRFPGIGTVDYLTSTALSLEALPKSLLVVGGGHIGAELAQMLARMGVQVTIVCRSHLLPAAEPEIAEALSGYLGDEGIQLKCGVAYKQVRKTDTGVALTVTREGRDETLTAERILVATGRAPNVEGLGLQEADVAQEASGSIQVDDRMRTTRSGVYAAGDVTGHDRFVYMAAYGAKLAAKNALNGDSLRYDNTALPAASRRAHPRAGRCRQHPDGGTCNPAGSQRRRSRGYDLSLSHHRRRPKARGAVVREGRDQVVVLRRIAVTGRRLLA